MEKSPTLQGPVATPRLVVAHDPLDPADPHPLAAAGS
jgi:hypothetical protein